MFLAELVRPRPSSKQHTISDNIKTSLQIIYNPGSSTRFEGSNDVLMMLFESCIWVIPRNINKILKIFGNDPSEAIHILEQPDTPKSRVKVIKFRCCAYIKDSQIKIHNNRIDHCLYQRSEIILAILIDSYVDNTELI